MKKIFAAALIAALLLGSTVPAAAESDTKAALLMDYETGQILYAHNIDQVLPPASITKLMTLHLVFEAIAEGRISLTDEVKVSAHASDLPKGSSVIFLGIGEVLTVKELLTAVAIISANDAGIALAEHVAGSESAFVKMMNEKARELGMTGTTFLNSHGLHAEGHNMSARDIAILSRATIEKYPEILNYSSQKFTRMKRDPRYVKEGYFDLTSTFRSLIGWRNIDGLKTGWTPEAGRCITVTAAEGERRYIAVVMGAKNEQERDQKVKELLALGFDQYQPLVAVKADEVLQRIAIARAKNQEVPVAAAKDLILIVKKGSSAEDFQETVTIKPGLTAPLAKGDIVGTLSYRKDGEEISAVDLVLTEDVAEAGFFTLALRYLSQVLTDLGKWIMGLFS